MYDIRQHRARTVLAIPLILVGFGVRAGTPPSEPAREEVHQEAPDDPPATEAAREDPSARSPARTVIFGPYVSRQVNVDDAGLNIVGDAANEPSIAVNPLRPGNMVVGWRQFDSVTSNFRQAGMAFTLNDGVSWTFPGVLEPGIFRSDPVVGFDSAGHAYYQSLTSNFFNQVFKSLNGGMTWGDSVPAFGGDKNWMAIDRSGGVGDGQIYGIWQRFFACCDEDTLTRSTDAGASFETPVGVALRPTFGTLAVGPDGELYAAGIDGTIGQDFNTFVAAKSVNARDDGTVPTFSGSVVDLGGSLSFQQSPNPAGLLGQVSVAVNHSPGKGRGEVYVVCSVAPSAGPGNLEVHFARSEDGGASWSPPVKINNDPPADLNWHWFGTLAVSTNNRIDAVWNDTRNGGQSNLSQLFYAYSYDGGRNWLGNIPVSPIFDSHVGWPNQNKIGDYYDIVSDQTGARVAYAATFNGEQDIYYVRLFPDCNANGTSDEIDLLTSASPDCNENRIPDECEVVNCLAAGGVSDGQGPGTPLLLDRAPGGDVALSWSDSCLIGDSDFGVYEGTLGGVFDSHVPVLCTTAGQTSRVLTPAGGSAYYLVVPRNSAREGSYGLDSSGSQRPPALGPCMLQEIADCPGGD